MQKTMIQILLLAGLIALFLLSHYLNKQKNQTKLHKCFKILSRMLQFYVICMFSQLTFSEYLNISPVYFEYFTGIVAVNIPVVLLYTAISYYKKNANLTKYWWLFIIPCISLLALWTNDLHHMFYKQYSIDVAGGEYGIFFTLHSYYSYIMMFVAVIIFVRASIKNSGFFSKQTALIVIGSLIPVIANLLATFKIYSMSVYITPLLFSATAICFSLAIIKYKALNITPIAFRTVIDTMSDAFVVISDDGTFVDSNKTFRSIFEEVLTIGENDNLFEILKQSELLDLERLQRNIVRTRTEEDIVSEEYHMTAGGFDKFFEVDIHPIKATPKAADYVGTLLLFKDITQHKKDIQAIEEKQDIIVKQGQLASIGELAGGVAHDINTPISAIKTGIVMLNSMTSERTDSEKEILYRMDNCATKIINIVNSMRNQIRNLGGDTIVKFKISEVVKDIKVITYHEVAKNKSEIDVDVRDDLEIKGDPTKLGQVLTNLVVNAVQAYGDKGGKINISIDKAPDNMAMIKVTDFAGGLDDNIAPFVFKNILTTKGIGGTGLGLYLAYSVIVGVFNGNITFDTEKGKGTTFYITIPIA